MERKGRPPPAPPAVFSSAPVQGSRTLTPPKRRSWRKACTPHLDVVFQTPSCNPWIPPEVFQLFFRPLVERPFWESLFPLKSLLSEYSWPCWNPRAAFPSRWGCPSVPSSVLRKKESWGAPPPILLFKCHRKKKSSTWIFGGGRGKCTNLNFNYSAVYF